MSQLAEWSCCQVRDAIKARGDEKKWVASFDGFYLTRGHYSNNCSATLHDFETGGIAWYCHRTKKGAGHNWEGTSVGAEGDMFDDLIGKAKSAGFVVSEIITDKDSSSIFPRVPSRTVPTTAQRPCTKIYRRSSRTNVK